MLHMLFFFFKQKTAYEMRISDWSSDVCSSDLDYIKRVIGLPGDTIQMRAGQVILNGIPVPRERIADFVIPQSPNYHCDAAFEEVDAAGAPACRYPRSRARKRVV